MSPTSTMIRTALHRLRPPLVELVVYRPFSSVATWLLVSLTTVMGCGDERKTEPVAAVAPTRAQPDQATPTPAAEHAPPEIVEPPPVLGPAPTPDAPAPPERTEPAPESADAFRKLAMELAGSDAGGDPKTSNKTAWAHYKARRYPEAVRHFAATALGDHKWKHAHNAACAAAKAGRPDDARVFLAESFRRGAAAAKARAHKDKDLEPVRAEPWFAPLLAGEVASNEPAKAAATEVPDASDAPKPASQTSNVQTGPCAKLPAGCVANNSDHLCDQFYRKIYAADFLAQVVRCMRKTECKSSCTARQKLPTTVTAAAKRACKALDDEIDADDPDDPMRQEWNEEMKPTCGRVMSVLTEKGRKGAVACLWGHCRAPGCFADLHECALDINDEWVGSFFDIDVEGYEP